MRGIVILALLIPMAAQAAPLDRRGLQMPDNAVQQRRPTEQKITLQPYRPPASANQPVRMNLGPFSAELGGEHKDGHFAHYKLEGTSILGGSLGGTVDGHSAKLELIWKNE